MDASSVLSIASLLFTGLTGVPDFISPMIEVGKLFRRKPKYEMMTPFQHANPLQMYYAYLFQISQAVPYGYSPFATGYPPGCIPSAFPMNYPYYQQPQFHQHPPSTSGSSRFKDRLPSISKLFGSSSSGSSHHQTQGVSRSASFQNPSHCPPGGGFPAPNQPIGGGFSGPSSFGSSHQTEGVPRYATFPGPTHHHPGGGFPAPNQPVGGGFSGSSSFGSSHQTQGVSRSATFPGPAHHHPGGKFPAPNHQPVSSRFSGPCSNIQVLKPQEAVDTYADDGLGMSTGGVPHFDDNLAIAHWGLFRKSGHGVSDHNSTIAVLDWTTALVTMYIRCGAKYYRNYRVSNVDVESFATVFQRNEVCSGIIRRQHLEAINKPMVLVPDNMQYGRPISSNCWTFLGIPCPRESLQAMGPAFLEITRGAVFGIINCLYTAPHRVNVDMKRLSYNQDCIHIDCSGAENALRKNPASDCAFTVFAFATKGWARETVLVG